MGLTHPSDLARWRRESGLERSPLRALVSHLRNRDRTPPGMLARPGPDADILFVLDSTTPSSLASVAAPIAHLDRRRVALLAPADL